MTGYRPDLDLSEFADHYDEWVSLWSDPSEALTLWSQDEPNLVLPPLGAATCSSSRALTAGPTHSWDVNGWYRTLGVPWPYVNATSGILSKCYIASGGQKSPRATYYLKRLLNRRVRAAYDAAPLGVRFLDDDYVQEELRMALNDEASVRRANGEDIDLAEVLAEHGYHLLDDTPDGTKDLDTTSNGGKNDLARPTQEARWGFGYWLWRSVIDATEAERLMRDWQHLLIANLAGRGIVTSFGVGVVGGDCEDGFVVATVDGHRVVFLHESAPCGPEQADSAATALITHTTTHQQ